MPKWLRANGTIIRCDDYDLWVNGIGWVPGAMLAFIARHHPELLREYIESIFAESTVNYDELIIR